MSKSDIEKAKQLGKAVANTLAAADASADIVGLFVPGAEPTRAIDVVSHCWQCGHQYTSDYDLYHGHKHGREQPS